MRIFACILAFTTGFLSLSQEILWVRLVSFVNYGLPQAFAGVLIFFLLGIAAGAEIGKIFCRKIDDLWKISGVVLIIAAFFDLVSVWIYMEFSQSDWQGVLGVILVFFTALFKAVIFPIAHQLGSSSENIKTGRMISRVYVSNIVGATAGPVATSLLLLNYFTTQQCYAITAMMTLLAGLYCLQRVYSTHFFNKPVLLVSVLMLLGFGAIFKNEPSLLIEKAARVYGTLSEIVETRQGIVTVYKRSKESGDVVCGGNVYDGRTNLDPVNNSNGIDRIIILSALQEKPEKLLIIGLSIGTWLKIATAFPSIKQIDVVEINPGYLKAMKQYPRQQSALSDPRVHLYIDDGRRWLKRHPENTYDLIIINTTFHWRAYSTNLLSKEFLSLVNQHIAPGGVMAFNATHSLDALKTAVDTFPHAYLYRNFVVASDFDWREKLKSPEAIAKISALTLDGKPLIPAGHKALVKEWTQIPIITLQEAEAAAGRRAEIVTDTNLITEYKHATIDP